MNNSLDSVIETLLSSDNKRRLEAESYINALPSTNFDEFIDSLLLSMTNSNPDVPYSPSVDCADGCPAPQEEVSRHQGQPRSVISRQDGAHRTERAVSDDSGQEDSLPEEVLRHPGKALHPDGTR